MRSNTEVLGLVSIEKIPSDQRIEIKLLASSRINVGPDKVFGLIVGNLIAFSCREAVKTYGINAAVSLVPKTKLKPYYIHQYGFLDGGRQLFLEGSTLLRIIAKYPA
ncbi:MAG: hypothetical protein ABIV51_02675 [Saprospiraceae bacterium]